MTARSTAQGNAATIRDETAANANTATRVGSNLRELADNCAFTEDVATASVNGLMPAADKALFNAAFLNGIDINQQRKRLTFKEDWANGTSAGMYAWVSTIRNSATIPNGAISTNSDQNHIGVPQIQTNALANGGATLSVNNFCFVNGTAQKWSYEILANVPVLSVTGTQQFIFRAGLGTLLTAADQTDGIYVEYDAATDLHWRGCTANASTRSKQNTTATVTAAQWDRLRFHTEDGITIRLEINGTDSGLTWSGASIPTAALGPFFQMDSSVGTTSKVVKFDYVDAYIDWVTPRAA